MSDGVELLHGDCLELLRTLPGNSVDAVVTDPPYGIKFMGRKWDCSVPGVEVWAECLRVLKPGGHLLAFAGTRTQHRMAANIEDAGFEIRDMIAWVYGSGFPKSLDVSKAIDKGEGESRARQLRFTSWMRSTGITAEQINEATGSCMASHYLTEKSQPAIATAGMFDKLRQYLPEVPEEIERLVCERTGLDWTAYRQREVVGRRKAQNFKEDRPVAISSQGKDKTAHKIINITAPATEAARQWQGWGIALKPALEPITVARKPLAGTVAANVLEHGTGALNIDGCRDDSGGDKLGGGACGSRAEGWDRPWKNDPERYAAHKAKCDANAVRAERLGRWPVNLIHDGSDEVAGLLGSAARFFYCTKASKADRDEGCEELEARTAGECTERTEGSDGLNSPRAGAGRTSGIRNSHPTVKPTELMRYLCRLVTPPDGVVLDPFMGSGSTGKAAVLEGFRFVGMEHEAEYIEIARARIGRASRCTQTSLFKKP